MPRRKNDGLTELMAFFQAFPEFGLICSGVLVAAGVYLRWANPAGISGLGPLIAIACWIFAACTAMASAKGFFNKRTRQNRLASVRDQSDLHDMTWRQFEQLIADTYRRQGFSVEEVGGSGDGGVDLILRRHGAVHLVQCKRYRTWKVGVQHVREFYGAMAAFKTRHEGIFVTCGEFTEDARQFARENPIRLIDGMALLELLATINPVTPAVERFADDAAGRGPRASTSPPD